MSTPDRNFCDSYADTSGKTLSGVVIDPRVGGEPLSNWADSLKLSNTSNFTGEDLVVYGASENAIDMNRGCKEVHISRSKLIGGDHCAVVVKGGCRRIFLDNIVIAKPTGSCDIELGGWSDQSKERTTEVYLTNVEREDGGEVRVVCGNADKPIVYGGKVKVLFWRSLALKTFLLLKGLTT